MSQFVRGSVVGLSTLRQHEAAREPKVVSEEARKRAAYLERYTAGVDAAASGKEGKEKRKKKKRKKDVVKLTASVRVLDEDVDWRSAPGREPSPIASDGADDGTLHVFRIRRDKLHCLCHGFCNPSNDCCSH
jgi:hypothetical protein